jgi:carbon storage regulator
MATWKESRVMLVLTRMLDESIVIDGNTRITVQAIRGNQVRLGIAAPRWISVMREELLDTGGMPPDDTSKKGGTSIDEEAGYPSG